jgi:uncharacterized protein (TIGR02996 family)
MMQEQALLQAVIENPQDDAIRLAYAAWLEIQGDPRAEFIRVQIELASPAMAFDANNAELPEILHRKALRARQEELLALHGKAWLGSLPELGWTYSRGFVESATVTGEEVARQFLAQADTVFRQFPLRSLTLRDDPGTWEYDEQNQGRGPARCLRAPSPISLHTLEALVALPHLSRLMSLNLCDVGCKFGLSTLAQRLLLDQFGDRAFSG